MAPSPRSAVVPLTVLGLLAAGLTAPAIASPAQGSSSHGSSSHGGPSHGNPAHRHGDDAAAVTLAPGVSLRHVSMQSDGAPEQVTLLGVNLGKPGVGVDAASPHGVVGDERATVRSQTNARHAIAGINADFFSLNRPNAAPRGALVTSGTMLKSPAAPRNANLVIRKSAKGLVASVGAVPFSGEVTRVRRGVRDHTRSLTTTNSLVSARAGGLTLLTTAMAPTALKRVCTLATGTIVRGTWTVHSVRTTHATPAFTSSSWGLVSCRGNGEHWIRTSLRRGDTVRVSTAMTGGTPWAMVSGGSVLVQDGKAWTDPLGEHLPWVGRNAETFACVGRTGRQLTLGTVDGYSRDSIGVTYTELTNYMLSLGHCYSGVVFDGGGSTTMVAKLPGSHKATVQNVPADHPARHVADTLVVFGS